MSKMRVGFINSMTGIHGNEDLSMKPLAESEFARRKTELRF